jgi:dTDP-4-dehydrorhamnose reductase
VDLTDENEVKNAVMQFKPSFLIHCAAQRFPEKVDLDPEGAVKINVDASRYLAQVVGMNMFFYCSTVINFQTNFMLVVSVPSEFLF